MKKKYFIYNRKTRRCLTRINYFDTPVGRSQLSSDLSGIEEMMPSVSVGEIFFNADKTVKEIVPKDVTHVRKR